MNPILGSRIVALIQWRKQVLVVHVEEKPQTDILRRINLEILDLVDRCLDLLDVPKAARVPRSKAYKKKSVL